MDVDKIEAQIEANRGKYDAAAAAIKADRTLTREQQAAELKARWAVASQHHDELRKQHRDAVKVERERLLTKATTLPEGDAMRNRDARYRARAAKTSADLRKLAGDALLDGDEGMQAAVISEAVDRGQLASVSALPGAQALHTFEETYGNPSSAEGKMTRSFRLRGPAAPAR